jgi:predicted small secreted protein
MKYAILIILTLTFAALTATACNTVHGVGETLEKSSDRSKP